MLLQDPKEVNGAHKNNHKQMLLQDPREVNGAYKIITNKCSYKTPERLTEHTKNYKQMLLQDSWEVDEAHKNNHIQLILQDPREVNGAHKKLVIQGVVTHIGPAKSFVIGRDQDLLMMKIYFDCFIPLKKILDRLIFYQKTWFA